MVGHEHVAAALGGAQAVAALAEDLGLAAKVAFGDSEEGDAAETPELPGEPEAAARGTRPLFEVVRPVRERLWLGEELNP